MAGTVVLKKLTQEQQGALTRILRALPNNAGIFLVGGTVRDLLLKRPTKDLDLVVTGVPMKRLERLLRPFGTVKKVGARFGVLLFRPKGTNVTMDIALPRTEHAFGTGGYRDFSFAADPNLPIEKDLARRDFTVNAMACDLRKGTLVDLHGGQKDLRNKVLRTVGKPEERFQEDYSRLLRLVRFVVQLGFSVERKTAASATELMPKLNEQRKGVFIVPREVIAEQFIRTIQTNPLAAFDLFQHFGVFATLLPEVDHLRHCQQSKNYHSEGTVFAHTRLAIAALTSRRWRHIFGDRPHPAVIVATLLHDIGKPVCRRLTRQHGKMHISFRRHDLAGIAVAQNICRRLRLSSYRGLVQPDEVGWLIRNHLLAIRNAWAPLPPHALTTTFTGGRGMHLLQLMYADLFASKMPIGKPALQPYHLLRQRLDTLLPWKHSHYEAPKPLISGSDLITLGMHTGPKIGTLLSRVYEAQLERSIRTKAKALLLARRLMEEDE